jgi:hypothetical protein
VKQFYIKIIDSSLSSNQTSSSNAIGEIGIGDFKETFSVPTEWWSVEDYTNQWEDAFDRFKYHSQVCLVTEITNPLMQILACGISIKKGKLFALKNKLFLRKSSAL